MILADNPKRQRLVGGRIRKGNTALSPKSRGQSPLVAMQWRKKAVTELLLGKVSFARTFETT